MPQPIANIPGEVIEHRVFDGTELIHVVSYRKMMEETDSGVSAIVSRGDSFRTVDGLVYNPLYATRQDPILLAVCHTCRHPEIGLFFRREHPTHGLCSLPNARQCRSCGITICPRHSELKRGRALCRRCATRNRIWKLIKPLFFRRVKE